MNMFAAAKPVAEKPKASKTKAKTQIETKDVELFCALKAVETSVKAQIAVVEAGLKSTILERGVIEGIRTGKQPESHEGIENDSVCSLQLRSRSSASGLSDEEVALLAEHNIPYGENVAVEACFRINPAYSDMSDTKNAEMLAKVSEALESLGLPADFIERQNKVSKNIVTEESIAAVCKLTHTTGKNKGKPDEATIAALLPLVVVPAIKPALAKGKNPFEIVDAALGELATA